MKKGSTYQNHIWKRFRKNKAALVSLWILVFFIVISFCADIIANRAPLYAKYRGRTLYPAFETLFHKSRTDSTQNPQTQKYEMLQFDITDWRALKLDQVIWPLIPYSPSQGDKYNMGYLGPGSEQFYQNYEGKLLPAPWIFRHHLGTNKIGEDVASGLLHGTGIALRVGLVAMSIAGIFGILIGSLAGYFGDRRFKINRGVAIMLVPGLFLGYFYGILLRTDTIKEAFGVSFLQSAWQILISLFIIVCVIALFVLIGRWLSRLKWFRTKVFVPIDVFVSRFIEIFDSIPALLLIITISSLFVEKSLYLVMVIIGFIAAPHIARLTRAEFLRIRNLEYIESARALGYKDFRIIWAHMLPNALAPVFVYMAFGIASAILTESGLSFLGIGVPADTVTWGSILSYIRDDYSAWWMAVFPGLAIFMTVTIFNLLGEGIREALTGD